jgi:hypothetical protein
MQKVWLVIVMTVLRAPLASEVAVGSRAILGASGSRKRVLCVLEAVQAFHHGLLGSPKPRSGEDGRR